MLKIIYISDFIRENLLIGVKSAARWCQHAICIEIYYSWQLISYLIIYNMDSHFAFAESNEVLMMICFNPSCPIVLQLYEMSQLLSTKSYCMCWPVVGVSYSDMQNRNDFEHIFSVIPHDFDNFPEGVDEDVFLFTSNLKNYE